ADGTDMLMSKVELTEQINQAIDGMMAADGVVPAEVDEQVAELLGIAVELRDLPRADFKMRLLRELKEEALMSSATKAAPQKTNPGRPGFHTVTPYLVAPDVHAEAEFLKQT